MAEPQTNLELTMHIIEHGTNVSNEFSTRLAHVAPALLAYADLLVLRQYAALSGVLDVTPTLTGVRGTFRHNAEIFSVELGVRASGAVELVCLDGPEAGERAEVSSMSELRAGLASGALADVETRQPRTLVIGGAS